MLPASVFESNLFGRSVASLAASPPLAVRSPEMLGSRWTLPVQAEEAGSGRV